MPPTPDKYNYDSSEIPHGEHLTMVDHIRAAFHDPAEQTEFLKERARQRKNEYDQEQKLKGQGQ